MLPIPFFYLYQQNEEESKVSDSFSLPVELKAITLHPSFFLKIGISKE